MKNFTAPAAAVIAVASAAVPSAASIVSYNASDVNPVLLPTNMMYGPNPYGSSMGRIWNERQNFTLTSNVVVDAVATGTYDMMSDLTTATVAAGTQVDSQYIVYDPTVANTLTTTVGFSGKILGVIVTSDRIAGDRLLNSDSLILAGVPSANRPTSHFDNRGLEFRTLASAPLADAFTINANNSITFRFDAASPGDQVRVITQAVPEPSAVAALGLGALGLLRRRRK